jgi:hypothetical protein
MRELLIVFCLWKFLFIFVSEKQLTVFDDNTKYSNVIDWQGGIFVFSKRMRALFCKHNSYKISDR